MRLHLTDELVSAFKYDGVASCWIGDADCKNLRLYIGYDTKVWRYYATVGGKQMSLSLGSFDAMTLAEARQKADELNQKYKSERAQRPRKRRNSSRGGKNAAKGAE
jgi:hypothetical protein